MTAGGRRFRAVFAEVAWREDMRRYRSSPAVQEMAGRARQAAEEQGVESRRLRACRAEGPDGTRLANCVKLYLPPEAAEPRFRMVFAAAPGALGWAAVDSRGVRGALRRPFHRRRRLTAVSFFAV